MDAAIKEGDYFTINWLHGGSPLDGKLVPEQLEEEALSREVLKIAKIAGNDWLDIQDAVMEYYMSTR